MFYLGLRYTGHLIRVPDTDDIRDRSFTTSQGAAVGGQGGQKSVVYQNLTPPQRITYENCTPPGNNNF